MPPVALWTGRLPGLRRLPRKRTLWAVGLLMLPGTAGALGFLGSNGPYLAAFAALIANWIIWQHQWPIAIPRRLRPSEKPQGPDERAVAVEIRHEGDLLGWDVGILWFEKNGIGFVGRTVSFVLPRASMQAKPLPHDFQSIFRAPHMTAKVFETTVGITPIGEEMKSQMTLARIDALPDTSSLETVLPPAAMHPDLLQRGLTVRRRVPFIVGLIGINFGVATIPSAWLHAPEFLPHFVLFICGAVGTPLATLGPPLPHSIRNRLPKL